MSYIYHNFSSCPNCLYYCTNFFAHFIALSNSACCISLWYKVAYFALNRRNIAINEQSLLFNDSSLHNCTCNVSNYHLFFLLCFLRITLFLCYPFFFFSPCFSLAHLARTIHFLFFFIWLRWVIDFSFLLRVFLKNDTAKKSNDFFIFKV